MDAFPARIEAYLLPDEIAEARQKLRDVLSIPAEKWIVFYEASSAEFFNGIIRSHSVLTPVHVYADSSLARRPGEHAKLVDLKNHGVDVTIGSSTVSRFFICHRKAIVVAPTPEVTEHMIWEGSTNFSEQSWGEINTIITFRSRVFGEAYIRQYDRMKANALANEGTDQLK